MEQWMKDRIEHCKKRLEEAIRSSTEAYIKGNDQASWETIEKASTMNGIFMIRAWSTSATVDLTYVCEALRYQDTGDAIASFSMEYYTIDQIAVLMIRTIDMLENGE